MIARWVCLSTGVWLASLQVGFYLLLETYVAATYLVYFLMVAVWLLGMMVGLSFDSTHESRLVGVALAAFYTAAWRLHASPSDAALVVALPCVAICGAYSGQFFVARQRLFAHVAQLFWWENTGFLVGWVVGILWWLWAGENTLLWLPLISFVCVLVGRRSLPDVAARPTSGVPNSTA